MAEKLQIRLRNTGQYGNYILQKGVEYEGWHFYTPNAVLKERIKIHPITGGAEYVNLDPKDIEVLTWRGWVSFEKRNAGRKLKLD